MQGFRISGRVAAIAAVSLCVTPTAAGAAYAPAPRLTGSYSPIVTLSILGSGISAAALCGAVAASAASANQAPSGGCVLPAVDAPPPVAVVEPPPPVYVPAAVAAPASTNFLLPLIGGLAALVGILALIGLFGHDRENGGLNPPPITPQ